MPLAESRLQHQSGCCIAANVELASIFAGLRVSGRHVADWFL